MSRIWSLEENNYVFYSLDKTVALFKDAIKQAAPLTEKV